MGSVEIAIYTGQGVVSYEIKAAGENFDEALTDALEKGLVSVETVEGSTLIINAENAVAIEIKTVDNPPTPF